ncbi:hypothetical protein BV898_10201 [Hypsibius exemplaris]|uniref:Uncharacterized protein n=1 Tax=Hypsibius exemplaris TaxID=2072580 RepID=A0A1W0WKB6_HYPEX|nr:hypothetical protein BV898_10201 [Hypsibius exemplaris]
MKAAVILLLVAVGACSAAFSGSLVERTQPVLNNANLRASITVSAFTKGDHDLGLLAQTIIQNVIARVRALIAHIQAQLELVGGHAHQLSEQVQAQVRATIALLQQIAASSSSQVQAAIRDLIKNLQQLLSGNDEEGTAEARQLVERLDILAVVQGALQDALTQLANVEGIQQLVQQLAPYLDQAQDIFEQISALLLGSLQLDRAIALRQGVLDILAQFQPIVAAIQAALTEGVGQVQIIAQGLIDQVIAANQASQAAALQHVIAQINALPSWLSSLAQPLVEVLESLGNN